MGTLETDEQRKKFRDSIYNFNRFGAKDKVRSKCMDPEDAFLAQSNDLNI